MTLDGNSLRLIFKSQDFQNFGVDLKDRNSFRNAAFVLNLKRLLASVEDSRLTFCLWVKFSLLYREQLPQKLLGLLSFHKIHVSPSNTRHFRVWLSTETAPNRISSAIFNLLLYLPTIYAGVISKNGLKEKAWTYKQSWTSNIWSVSIISIVQNLLRKDKPGVWLLFTSLKESTFKTY